MSINSFFLGRLIAIGGNEDKVDDLVVLKKVVEEIGKSKFRVGVITTASKTPEKSGDTYRRVFKMLDAAVIEVLDIRNREQANDQRLVKALQDVDLIYITGGDQLRLTAILGGTKVLEAIYSRLEDGALIVGTSAGAAAFSDTMIYEGTSKEGLLKGSVLFSSGFGFIKKIIIDTHFMTRGRIGRLLQIVAMNPSCIGLGIEEDSGVILQGDGRIEVIGTGQVIVVDGSDIGYSNILKIDTGESIAVENVRLHSLVDGYGFELKKRKFLPPPRDKKESKDD